MINAFGKIIIVATLVGGLNARTVDIENGARAGKLKNPTLGTHEYEAVSGGLGRAVDVDALEWKRQAAEVFADSFPLAERPAEAVICFFSVKKSGKIKGCVRFSRALEPEVEKKMVDAILSAKLPALNGKRTRKIFLEIAQGTELLVGFAN